MKKGVLVFVLLTLFILIGFLSGNLIRLLRMNESEARDYCSNRCAKKCFSLTRESCGVTSDNIDYCKCNCCTVTAQLGNPKVLYGIPLIAVLLIFFFIVFEYRPFTWILRLQAIKEAVTQKKEGLCSKCGKKLDKHSTFCKHCGTKSKLKKKKNVCECGNELTKENAYCPECGKKVK